MAAELAEHRVTVRWLLDRCGILRSPVTACTGSPPGDRPCGAACEEPARGILASRSRARRRRVSVVLRSPGGLPAQPARALLVHARLLARHDAAQPLRPAARLLCTGRPGDVFLGRRAAAAGDDARRSPWSGARPRSHPWPGSTDAAWAWQEEGARPAGVPGRPPRGRDVAPPAGRATRRRMAVWPGRDAVLPPLLAGGVCRTGVGAT